MDEEPQRRGKRMAKPNPYWEKPLEDLTAAEWESLCDGCGRCCLVNSKMKTLAASISPTSPAGCSTSTRAAAPITPIGAARSAIVSNSRPDLAASLHWLPPTCAYRLRAEGKPLAWWHPLVSGSPETVHEAGISVRGRVD